jgi:DNA-binding NtrC family response regulator
VLPATARTPAVATTGDGERRVETILVVDDDVALRLLVKRMLERAGYRVLLAASPEEALRTALEHEGTIHMTLTDVLMPGGMSGVGLAQRLRAILPGMKVVLMSGYTAEALPDEGLCPSDPFLGKPFELGELLRIVRSTIDS